MIEEKDIREGITRGHLRFIRNGYTFIADICGTLESEIIRFVVYPNKTCYIISVNITDGKNEDTIPIPLSDSLYDTIREKAQTREEIIKHILNS